MKVRVVSVSGSATLQDAGRPGWRRFGVPPGGVFDRLAAESANGALAQDSTSCVIELAYGSLALECLEPGRLTLAGALESVASARPPTGHGTYDLQPGDALSFAISERGMRAVAGTPGGWEGESQMGSLSGVKVQSGDVLSSNPAGPVTPGQPHEGYAKWLVPASLDGKPLRVVPGPYADRFDLNLLVRAEFEVTPLLDRKGVRLAGPAFAVTEDIVSEPVIPGLVQVANDGQLIIIGPDGPTIGGYPAIAVVVEKDLSRVAQLRPGAIVRFEWRSG